MKILLADDHALIRSGLRGELVALDADADFVEAWDADSLRQVFALHDDLDLALVDLTMPGMSGARTIGELRQDFPAVPVIVLSGVESGPEVHAVLRAGAAGYIPKSAKAQVMVQAIRLVLAGGQYLPPQLMQYAGNDPSRTAVADPTTAAAESRRAFDMGRLKLLSPRQKEVFALLAKGLSNKLIARQLNVAEGTIKSHVATIFDVLNVHNRVSAVTEAQRLAGELDHRRLPDP